MTHNLWTNLNIKMLEYLSAVSLEELVRQQHDRTVTMHDHRGQRPLSSTSTLAA